MIQKWIEEVVLRKIVLNIVKLLVAWCISHLANLSGNLSVAGLTVQVDPAKLTDFLNGTVFIGLHELQVWATTKYPALAQYI